MGTNQEHGKLTAKATVADDLTQQSDAPPAPSVATCESSDDVIKVLNSVDERTETTVEDLPRLDPRVRAHLGRLVRTTYAALVEEPVPERFLNLLEELERAEKRS